LPRADLEFLLEHHRRHVEVAFIGRRGRYRLTPRGVAGVIVLPNVRLHIEPKIAPAELLFLFDPQTPPASGGESAGVSDVLTRRLAALMRERAAAGLHRGYVERSDALATPIGRLDVPALARDAAGRRDRLPCRFDEFTTDVPCNRLVKAAAERVVASPALNDGVRAELQQALAAFAEAGPTAADDAAFAAALADPLTVTYRPLLELCRALGNGLLIDLERVFERYVTRGLVEYFAGREIRVEVQPWTPLHAAADGPALGLRPDVVLRRGAAAVAVADAKWKRFSGTPDADDLHQILAYATALGVPRVALVYPGRRSRVREVSLAHSPVTLALHVVRVAGDRTACRRSLRRFARSLVE
jgi:5-methylcytosine-specific restriction enzyme subunit McrC